MVSFTPTEVNGRTLQGTFIVPFSFWYSGLTLNDATLLVSDRKLGENKQKSWNISNTVFSPDAVLELFPKTSYFCTNDIFWRTCVKTALARWDKYCAFCYFVFSLCKCSYFAGISACKKTRICISSKHKLLLRALLGLFLHQIKFTRCTVENTFSLCQWVVQGIQAQTFHHLISHRHAHRALLSYSNS